MKKAFSLFLVCVLVLACQSNSSEEGGAAKLSQKGRQYYTEGKNIYAKFCSNCHKEDGTGLGLLIPPLKGADYLLSDLTRAARIIKFGQSGPITVNGQEFNQPMPANPQFTNLEIAELVTYISNSWGNEGKAMTIAEVEAALEEN